MNRGAMGGHPATAFVLTHESNPARRDKSISLIALAIARSLGRHGVPVVRVHPNRLDHSLSSRYCSAVEISPDFYADEKGLLDFLLRLPARYPGRRVLIPASDDCAYFVARHRAALGKAFAVAAPGDRVMQGILDKQRQYEHAASLGIPIPETWFPASLDEVRELAPRLEHYPYVIKPLVAHAWRLASMQRVSKGRKGFAVGSPAELVERYAEIGGADSRVMIQEVIGGADERLFTFLSYSDARGRPVAWCVRRKIRQFPVDFGYCTLTESCHDEVVREQSTRLLRGLHFQGLSGVEWKLDERTGLYKLIEVNPRAVNTIGLAAACGVDLPWIAFRDLTGHPPTVKPSWQNGVKWMQFEMDWWAARELRRRGQLDWRQWRASLAGPKVDAIFSRDDLAPFFNYGFDIFKALLCQRWRALGRAWKRSRIPGKAWILADTDFSQKTGEVP